MLPGRRGRHPRRQLAQLLWPRSDGRHARTDLRSALAKLRKTLGKASAHDEKARFFVIEGDLLGIEPTSIELDLNALEGSVSLARRQTSSQGESSADAAEAALGRRELIGRLQGALEL